MNTAKKQFIKNSPVNRFGLWRNGRHVSHTVCSEIGTVTLIVTLTCEKLKFNILVTNLIVWKIFFGITYCFSIYRSTNHFIEFYHSLRILVLSMKTNRKLPILVILVSLVCNILFENILTRSKSALNNCKTFFTKLLKENKN